MGGGELAGPGGGRCCARWPLGKAELALLAGVLVALDRASKVAVEAALPHGASRSVVDGFFNLVHVRNTGIAFSLFADAAPWFRDGVLPAFSVAAIVVILVLFRRFQDVPGASRVALALILSGAVGNLYDRLQQGYVTDFLDFFVGSYHWPAFNVADSAITVGAALLLLESFRGRRAPGPGLS